METRANFVLIGAFTLIVGIFGVLFALWAAKYSSQRDWIGYQVIFDEPVSGLGVGASVRYNGIVVGTIKQLSLDERDPRRVVAKIDLEADTPVKTDTRARLSIDSLTGPAFILLTGGSPSSPLLTQVDKREWPVIPTQPSALQNIADTANRLVTRLDTLMSEENIQRVTTTLANLETISTAVAGQRGELVATLHDLRQASAQLNQTLAHADQAVAGVDTNLVQKLPALVQKLDATLSRLDAAAGTTNAMLDENRAAVRSFSSDGLAQLGPTLSDLRALTRDLRRISDRIEQTPNNVLLGGNQTKEFTPK
jgi:phospholipid/cholesterol/gamma-HCH transport system substrate-binding protein